MPLAIGMALSKISLHDLSQSGVTPPALFERTRVDVGAFFERVRPIIEAVRTGGDTALLRFGATFDGVTAAGWSLRASDAEFASARGMLSEQLIADLEFAAHNIRSFHEAQKPEEMWMKEIRPGVWAGDRHVPIESVACYVPRGKGSFPSVLLMTAIPAVVAGVPRPIIITPPGPDGTVDAATLVAAELAGIREVYKCGGAQGIAAVAYGTETVPKCLKVVGPGSPWVVAAKRLLSDVIDPGVPAGPSESIILADETADGELAALDLLIEAEHGPDSSAYLVTNSRTVAEAALGAVPMFLKEMSEQRASFAEAVLGGTAGGIVLTKDFQQAIDFANEYAPEHLEVLARDPWDIVGKLRNAGEILLGRYTPITLGNFVIGVNAVLPTARHSRTASPLSVFDYMKRMSIASVTKQGYDTLAPHAYRLAKYEGFDAHARAVSSVRQKFLKD
jgi:histidinol dehydrogenase